MLTVTIRASIITCGNFLSRMVINPSIFSIFRRTAEYPLYRIEKRPKLRNRQGQYAVIGMDGHIIKRGSDLKTVLRVLERKLIRAVEE